MIDETNNETESPRKPKGKPAIADDRKEQERSVSDTRKKLLKSSL